MMRKRYFQLLKQQIGEGLKRGTPVYLYESASGGANMNSQDAASASTQHHNNVDVTHSSLLKEGNTNNTNEQLEHEN